MTILNILNNSLKKTIKVCSFSNIIEDNSITIKVEPANNHQFGHYQTNICMILAKKLKTSPINISNEIIDNFTNKEISIKPEISGPGFINFRITNKFLINNLFNLLNETNRLGVDTVKNPKNIVIDYSSPNIAKPMHVGHIRSTIIGNCLYKIAKFLGHNVISDNHIGDWGTQFGMILWGWKNILDSNSLEKSPMEELLRIYKEVSHRIKNDESLHELCKDELVKLQNKDPENIKIWNKCIELSKKCLTKIYKRLDVSFDHWLGESFYNDKLAPLVNELIEASIAKESNGAICVFFEDSNTLHDKPAIIQKSDGGFLYATTDLATIEYRINNFKADMILYVVGSPQQLHFDQIFNISKKRNQKVELKFVPFGSILGKDKKLLRTRSGESIQLNDVLDESIKRSRDLLNEKESNFTNEKKEQISKVVGISSVKYYELSQYRISDYIFDWDKMLSLKGNTAPYLLNAYVRTRSVFRKLGMKFNEIDTIHNIKLIHELEVELSLKLSQFGEIIPTTFKEFKPHLLANYLYSLASLFHSFWESCPILNQNYEIKYTRLLLCEVTSKIIKKGLYLMGIETLDEM